MATVMPSKMSMLVMTESDVGSWIYKPGWQTAWYPGVAFVFDYTNVQIVIRISGFWIVFESCIAACLCFGCSCARDVHCVPIAPRPVYILEYTHCTIAVVIA